MGRMETEQTVQEPRLRIHLSYAEIFATPWRACEPRWLRGRDGAHTHVVRVRGLMSHTQVESVAIGECDC